MKFRKKLVVIDAIKNEGTWPPIIAFMDQFLGPSGMHFQPGQEAPIARDNDGSLKIHTLEGTMLCNVGDWLIRGVEGEFYPCKPGIFEATYEPA